MADYLWRGLSEEAWWGRGARVSREEIDRMYAGLEERCDPDGSLREILRVEGAVKAEAEARIKAAREIMDRRRWNDPEHLALWAKMNVPPNHLPFHRYRTESSKL